MKHLFRMEGYGYRLRPIQLTDAPFIIEVRLEDQQRSQFIHTIPRDVSAQEAWIQAYFDRDDDFYFVVENRLTGLPEGLISFYNAADGVAEWGRWIIKKGSLAASESVYLLYRVAFEQAGLQELYCRTVSDNISVVSFHRSIGEKTRTVHKDLFELNGKRYDAVEQYAGRTLFYETIAPKLEKQAQKIAIRNLQRAIGRFEFHHIGIATKGIEKEFPFYSLIGYEKEGASFIDPLQGIGGQFLVGAHLPRLELLENLPNAHTLDKQLEQRQKLYHMAYYVSDIERAIAIFQCNRAKIISSLKPSVYFGSRICFLMLPNMMMIELLEAQNEEG